MKALISLVVAATIVIGAAAVGATGVGLATFVVTPKSGCTPNKHTVCVTEADNGRTVRIPLGDTAGVFLAQSGLVWSGLHQIGTTVLREEGTAVQSAKGLAVQFKAIRVGRATLQATGAPKCPPQQACPQFVLLWQTRIVVYR